MMSRASRSASSSSCPAGTTLFTSPMRCASAASMNSPVRTSSRALFSPTLIGSNFVAPPVIVMPALPSGNPNLAFSAATIRSESIAISNPPPTASPRTDAITTFRASADDPRDGLETLGNVFHDVENRVNLAGLDLRILLERDLQILAGAEGISDARDDDRLDLRVIRCLAQCTHERPEFFRAQRIQDLGPIEPDPGNFVLHLIQQLGHWLVFLPAALSFVQSLKDVSLRKTRGGSLWMDPGSVVCGCWSDFCRACGGGPANVQRDPRPALLSTSDRQSAATRCGAAFAKLCTGINPGREQSAARQARHCARLLTQAPRRDAP